MDCGVFTDFMIVSIQFFSEDRIIHVYGKLREQSPPGMGDPNWEIFGYISEANTTSSILPWDSQLWDDTRKLFDRAYDAAQDIEIIAPDKAGSLKNAETPKRAVSEAECFYILGYGFDKLNNDLLGIPDKFPELRTTSAGRSAILFTNYKNRGTVNKTVSRMLFSGRPDKLSEDRLESMTLEPSLCFCEKSIKNVYDALAYDFDSPEASAF
jgi:hypothetical protein